VGEETEDSFDRDECRVQRDADNESAIEIGRRVRVAVIVAHSNDYTSFAPSRPSAAACFRQGSKHKHTNSGRKHRDGCYHDYHSTASEISRWWFAIDGSGQRKGAAKIYERSRVLFLICDHWSMMDRPLFIIAMVVIAVRQLSASSATEIIISIPDQTLAVVDSGKLIARYRVSTSKFGNGDDVGSYRTPLGTLFVSGKFGDHLPAGTVIKNRAPTGEIIAVDAPNRDAIVSRVIWLRGMERQNLAAHDRCIYIHGTPEERRVGRAASFGCVRATSSRFMIASTSVCTSPLAKKQSMSCYPRRNQRC
jgi:lipoprotein-anchoring transpeptidase ErfK/SrfK